MLVSEKLYQYLLTWLIPAMEEDYKQRYGELRRGNVLRGLGKWGPIQSWEVDRLRTVVRQQVCNDKFNRFLSDGSKRTLYAYNGICFEQVEDREIFLKELIKRAFVSLELGDKYNDEFPAKVIAESCLSTLSSSDRYLYRPNRRYIAFRDVIYDVEKGKAVKPTPEQCPAIRLDLEYKDKDLLYKECSNKYGVFGNPCKLWDTKIAEILPNKDARSVFQQWCGALLADKAVYKLEHVLFLVGPGANGKSVISNVIASVFGKEYFSRFSFRQLFKDSDRNVNIAALRGKLANFIDDVDGAEISGGDFKRFASGGEFEGRVPYEKKPVTVTAPPLLCCCNVMPETEDDSYGGHRRRLVVHTRFEPFEGETRDTQLTYKLTRPEALMYIFHWIVDGYKTYVRNKGDISMSEQMKKSQDYVISQSNSMRRWWAESGYVPVREYDIDKWRSLKDLMSEYDAFCAAEHSKAFKQTEVSAMIASKGCFKKQRSSGYGYCLEKRKDYNNEE